MHPCAEKLWKINVTSFNLKFITVFTFLMTEANLLSGVKLVTGRFKMEKPGCFSLQ